MEQKYAFGLLRISVGLFFLFIGYSKWLLGKELPIRELLPFVSAGFVPYIIFAVAIIEILIGICLMLGVLTRIAAWVGSILLAVYIIGAIAIGRYGFVMHKIAIFGAAFFIALTGEQKKEEKEIPTVEQPTGIRDIKSEVEAGYYPKKRGRPGKK